MRFVYFMDAETRRQVAINPDRVIRVQPSSEGLVNVTELLIQQFLVVSQAGAGTVNAIFKVEGTLQEVVLALNETN